MILRRKRWAGCSSVNAMPPKTCIEPCATSRAARETYAFATDAVSRAPGMPSSSAAAAYSVVDHALACLTWRSAMRCRRAWLLPIVRPNCRRSAAYGRACSKTFAAAPTASAAASSPPTLMSRSMIVSAS